MADFKKTVSVNGKYKELVIKDGNFVLPETGEVVDVAAELEKVYGDNIFSLTTSYKADYELGGDE